MSVFEAMVVDPLIHERFIDEMAARGISLEVGSEPMAVSELVEAIYTARGEEIFVSSIPSLGQRMEAIRNIREWIQAAEWQWAHLWTLDSPDEPIDNSPGSLDPRYIAMTHLFARSAGNVVETEAAVCQYYGIKPGTFITAMCMVESAVDRVLQAHGGAVVCGETMQKLSAKQVVGYVLQEVRPMAELEEPGIVFSKRLVEDILTLLGVMAIVRKSREVESMSVSPEQAIKSGRYQVQVRYADEIADAYRECAQEGNITSCMAKRYSVADGLSLQYGSLRGVHAVVVIYKTHADGTRKPVARFLVERAACVNCGTIHTVISRRYSDGAMFSMSVAEFVAKCIADGVERSAMYEQGSLACKVCSSPLATVLDVPEGIEHPVWCDWAMLCVLFQVPDTPKLMEVQFSGVAGIDRAVIEAMTFQRPGANHVIDGQGLDPRTSPGAWRLYELACKLAHMEEPPISQDRLASIIDNA
jgi:hypothetical protein